MITHRFEYKKTMPREKKMVRRKQGAPYVRERAIHPSLHAYEFMELAPYKTHVYTFRRDNRVYIIGTFRGSTFMDAIKADHPGKDFVVINTHYRFDCIWGNHNLSHCPIYAHQLCKAMVQRHGVGKLQEQKKYFQGAQTLTLPNYYSDGRQLQMADGLQPLYTPGHTLDGVSVYDQTLNALFIGDTLEKPLIQIEGSSLSKYRQALEYFLTLPVTHFYAGHALWLAKADIRDTLAYTRALSGNETIRFDLEETQGIHSMNLNARKQ